MQNPSPFAELVLNCDLAVAGLIHLIIRLPIWIEAAVRWSLEEGGYVSGNYPATNGRRKEIQNCMSATQADNRIGLARREFCVSPTVCGVRNS